MLTEDLDFDLKMIYDALYYFSCFASLVNAFNQPSDFQTQAVKQAENRKHDIKTHLTVLFTDMVSFDKTAAQLHQKTIGDFDVPWMQLQNNSICLWCLRQKSENSLFCHHVICNVCV